MIVAKKPVFTSGALAVLEKKPTMLKSAKDSVNPFSNWKGPLGKYYARLRLIVVKESKTPGAIDFIFMHTCLARLPDSSSTTATPDEQYAGETMRIWASTAASKKAGGQTEEQAWERTMQTIQAYDIKTSKFGMRSGMYNHAEAIADMAAALDYLNEKAPAVIIEVASGRTGGTFLNVQGVVDEKVVARFGKVEVEMTDDMIGELPDDHDVDEPAPASELPDEDGLRKAAEEFSDESLIEMLSGAISAGEIILPAGVDVKLLPRNIIIDIGINAQMQRPLPDLSQWTPKSPTIPSIPSSAPVSSAPPTAPTADDDEEGPATSVPDDDAEELPPSSGPTEAEKALMTLQMEIAAEDRAALKKRLRNMGALRPEDKFTLKADGTLVPDDEYRQWIIDVFTGVKPRVVAVAPTEVPFK